MDVVVCDMRYMDVIVYDIWYMDVVVCDIWYMDVVVVCFIMYEHTVIFGYYRERYVISACFVLHMYMRRTIMNCKPIEK